MANNRLLIFKSLFSFGFSQIIVLITALARIPILFSVASPDESQAYFFWFSLVGLLSLLVNARNNQLRLSFFQASDQIATPGIGFSLLALLLPLIAQVVAMVLYPQGSLEFKGGLYLATTILSAWYLGPWLALAQADGRYGRTLFSTSVGSLLSLVLVIIASVTEPKYFQAHCLEIFFLSSTVSIVTPYILSVRWGRSSERVAQSGRRDLAQHLKFSMVELGATMPVTLLTAIDSIALNAFASQEEFLAYSIATRFSLILFAIPSALYVPMSNLLSEGKSTLSRKWYLVPGLTNLLLLPLAILVVIYCSEMSNLLSSGQVSLSTEAALLIAIQALLLPWWQRSSMQPTSPLIRYSAALRTFKLVLPLTYAATLMTAHFGAVGPLTSTLLGIALAIALQEYSRRAK